MSHPRRLRPPRILAVVAATALGVAAFSAAQIPVQAATVTSPTADTFTEQDTPAVNYAAWPRWSADVRTGVQRHSYLRFNAVVPAGEQVATATLRAYSEAASTGTGGYLRGM
jgi:hypothetical protein